MRTTKTRMSDRPGSGRSGSESIGPISAERRVRAMGCDAHVIVVGRDAQDPDVQAWADSALRRIEQLEARWSRFRETSEVSQLNAHPGRPTIVSADTFLLVERAVRASELTGGRYDPTVLDAVVALGYDRDFREVRSSRRPLPFAFTGTPGCHGIMLNEYLSAVTFPTDVGFDPGGIGKGLAADLVVTELIAAGAAGAMVNLGGDLRAIGLAPTEAGWVIGVENPRDRNEQLARVAVRGGGVCTSSRLRRSWKAADGTRVHHLVDPARGESLTSDIATVTVVAGEAWWAEALAKSVFVAGVTDREPVEAMLVNAHALVIADDGSMTSFGDPGVFELAETSAGSVQFP